MGNSVYSKVIAFAIAVFIALTVRAEDVLRPVMAAYSVEIGSSHLADTYLTPLKYNGLTCALSYERMQAMKFSPDKWVMQLSGRLNVDRDENPAKNATMWDLDIDLSWAMMSRFNMNAVKGLAFYGGGMTDLKIGALYLSRNGNNPISAKAAWTVGLEGAAVWNTRVGRLPVCLRYQVKLPVVGAFFSPDYGELYYEIYLGNHENLAHAAWWGNYFRLDNLLTADLRFGSTNLRLGYRADLFSSKTNSITCRNVSHAFVFGVSGEWLSMPRAGKISQNAKIISAIY